MIFRGRFYTLLLVMYLVLPSASAYDIRNGATIELREIPKLFSENRSVLLWVYCLSGVPINTPGECAAPTYPGPLLELGVGQTASVTLDLMTVPPPSEAGSVGSVENFLGHTIHFANLDLPTIHDGVPAPFPSITNTLPTNTGGHTYNIDLGLTNPGHVGSHAYYCHVHQTKHLEMGEFGALIVRPVNSRGGFINTINQGGPSFDVEANFVLSTIDPAYHVSGVVGEDPVFASYNPSIFLVNGNEGLAFDVPAVVINALTSQVVAIRLIGLQGVNATFQIVDSVQGGILGTPQNFDLHNIDGWTQTTRTTTLIHLSPGQTKDILVNMPAAATTWYPLITYTNLRDDSPITVLRGNPQAPAPAIVYSAMLIQ